MLGCGTGADAMTIPPAEKFKEDLQKRLVWWETEFDLDHFAMVGVLLDVAVDLLFGSASAEEDEEDDDDSLDDD